ncbi:Rieske (2Fe-2S) protein [Xanthobacter autotrophicus]|uniref:Rieske (2Fe-2S) protein n=1 Tax=Xanthobacter autotrophicus TaxID=280 RepID=UPI0024A79F7C|nr:Rieske 2Fe-2S domain-containing protein [Xanthobacter autotrophicus]MDI4655311.1 Rieske 2Fe-2S domain-containing protein [Xanthobacter autotrophicus]
MSGAVWAQRPNAPAPGTNLGRLDDIPDGGGKEFVFGQGVNAWRMFVVRKGASLYGYLNLCPHYSMPLNHQPDIFMSRDGTRIMCRQHLALFRVEDGTCLDGACDGRALDPVPLRLEHGQVVIG